MGTKLSRLSFFLFVFSYNFLWLRFILFNFFYSFYGNMCWLYALILAFGLGIIFLFIPKKILDRDFNERYLKSKFKYLYNLVLFLEVSIGISFCIQVLYSLFFPEINYYLVVISISLVVSIISSVKKVEVIQLATLFNILGIIMLIFGYVYYISVDIELIFPFKSYSIGGVIFSIFLIFFNNINLLLIEKDSFQLNKFFLTIPLFLAMLFFSFELFLIVITAGDKLLVDVPWIGFVSLSIKPVAKYVGNFDFAYIILILIFTIFKFSFNIALIRRSFNKKINNLLVMLLLVILGICIYKFLPFNDNINWISSVIILMEGLLMFWLIKEGYYARKIKE